MNYNNLTTTTINNKQRDVTIFSMKVVKDLLRQGFKLKNMTPRKENPNKSLFYFESTPEIKKYLKTVHNIIIE